MIRGRGFAIAITLLVLEISVPVGSEEDLLGAIKDDWRSYLAYVSSFATIGALWLAHSVATELLAHVVGYVLIALFSLVPFGLMRHAS